ncbi:hypothetical protein [Klebsiella phage phiKp_21]|nr:hypothetical protein DIDNDMLP_00551 [Klebsiella phage KP13-7]BEH88501.1 hypothetical protein [Klebsiella phage phiKp_21]
MKKQETNIISNEDYRKVQSMVMNQYNKSNLHPDVHLENNQYRIDGISHLSQDVLLRLKTKVCVDLLKEIISTEWNLDKSKTTYKKEKIVSVKNIGSTDDYVYDISMGGINHYFFANNILVHNTDSVYFSVVHYLKEQNIPCDLSKEEIVDMYIKIGDEVGESFPEFMDKMFNTGIEKGKIVGADLEMVGSRGLFLKKKRYAILKYWEDGFRKDVDGKPGEIKAMGLEIKRSDTPKYIQNFLEETLMALLVGESESELKQRVRDFKAVFKDKPAHEKGSPRTVKNYSNLEADFKNTGKCHVGHVLAGIQWNMLRNAYDDKTVPEVTDGTKVIVCDLKPNPLGITKIGYPIDCAEYLPEWFLELPFDTDKMEEIILTKKLDNIFGILDMDIGIHEKSTAQDFGFFS